MSFANSRARCIHISGRERERKREHTAWGEKIPRYKIKNCECVECTTAAYRVGCLCCYLLHRKKNSCTHKEEMKYMLCIYKFLPILNAIFFIFFLFESRATTKKENFYSQLLLMLFLTTTLNQRD